MVVEHAHGLRQRRGPNAKRDRKSTRLNSSTSCAQRTPYSTRTDPLFPYTTLRRSVAAMARGIADVASSLHRAEQKRWRLDPRQHLGDTALYGSVAKIGGSQR